MEKNIKEMVEFLEKRDIEYWQKAAKDNNRDFEEYLPFLKKYEVQKARKYTKIFVKDTQRCIFMFIDEEGNIYKPANYKSPAKGIRGHISNWRQSLTISPLYSVVTVNYNR